MLSRAVARHGFLLPKSSASRPARQQLGQIVYRGLTTSGPIQAKYKSWDDLPPRLKRQYEDDVLRRQTMDVEAQKKQQFVNDANENWTYNACGTVFVISAVMFMALLI